MNRFVFKVTLLSDIIIHANSATEGHRKTFDFIPGSNFLGVLARHYNEFDNPYDIFHNDKVRFGDAHISLDSNKSFKTPLSWFYKKGEGIESEKWVHHLISPVIRENLIKDGNQLKQAREGWIVSDKSDEGKLIPISSDYAIKSAYDRKKRTSKEGKLFTFKSLDAGSEWIFYVDIDDALSDGDKKKIVEYLTGKKHIAKSRTAQYGSVEIGKIDKEAQVLSSNNLLLNKYLVIYAESRLSFFNEFGVPTLQPTVEDFNLSSDWELDWEKCQVRSQTFAPYNFKNRSFLADRVCFEKGSVFVFEKMNNASFNLGDLLNGVGEFKNEGFGQIIINPNFLNSDEQAKSLFRFLEHQGANADKIFAIKESDKTTDDNVLDWIRKKENSEKRENDIYKSVTAFINEHLSKFVGITPSQWGQIRAIATNSADFDEMMAWLFTETTPSSPDGIIRSQDRSQSGFLEHGKMEKKWKKGKEILKTELNSKEDYGTDYATILAAQMQKKAKKQEERNEL